MAKSKHTQDGNVAQLQSEIRALRGRLSVMEQKYLACKRQLDVASRAMYDYQEILEKRDRQERRREAQKGKKGKSVGIRRSMIFARDNHTCIYCGRSSVTDGVVLQVDHVIPVSKGGTNEAANLVTSCMACNLAKNAKLVDADQILAVVRERNFNAGIPDDRDMIG